MQKNKRNSLVKAICDKKGFTSMILAGNLNADMSFVGKIVREAGVRTYKGIKHPEFRPELEQRQKRECGKNKGRNTHFEPYRHRDGPSCCPITSSYR